MPSTTELPRGVFFGAVATRAVAVCLKLFMADIRVAGGTPVALLLMEVAPVDTARRAVFEGVDTLARSSLASLLAPPAAKDSRFPLPWDDCCAASWVRILRACSNICRRDSVMLDESEVTEGVASSYPDES